MDEAVKKYMSELGKKSWEKRKGKQDMKALAQKAVEKRKLNKKSST